ncbi:MAG: thioredoxin domain-containing protein, partial [Thermodesulfobacteriota bacterium]
MLRHFLRMTMVAIFVLIFVNHGLSQEDKAVKAALEIFKSHVRLPPGTEIKVLEKKESQIPDFYTIRFLLLLPDKEMPAVVYVDKNGEKVILGTLYIKGENITAKEGGPPKPKKIDMGMLEMDKSPYVGNKEAKVVIVEFSNFQCPYCMDSWTRFMGLLKRYPKEFKYIFKHFPFHPQGRTFELSEMAAAAYEVGNEAFWSIHDFFFTQEGQEIANKMDKETVRKKVEQILKGKGHDIKIFQSALETGRARSRVLGDM